MSLPGRADVALSDLIVPYRFDIVIRRNMIARMIEAADASDEQLVEAAADTSYDIWFEEIEVARFRPGLRHDDGARRSALLQRIHGLQSLIRSMQNSGDELTQRLVLDWHFWSAESESGVTGAYSVAPADGCHRIAYLLHAGRATLTGSDLRLRACPGSTILDNTARLLRSGRVKPAAVAGKFADIHSGFRAVMSGESSDDARAPEFREWINRQLEGGVCPS